MSEFPLRYWSEIRLSRMQYRWLAIQATTMNSDRRYRQPRRNIIVAQLSQFLATVWTLDPNILPGWFPRTLFPGYYHLKHKTWPITPALGESRPPPRRIRSESRVFGSRVRTRFNPDADFSKFNGHALIWWNIYLFIYLFIMKSYTEYTYT